jgi:hypothetical protein
MPQEHKRCAQPDCTCRVADNAEYCSAGCETAAAGKMRDGCSCGHPGCAASETNADAEGRPASTITKNY